VIITILFVSLCGSGDRRGVHSLHARGACALPPAHPARVRAARPVNALFYQFEDFEVSFDSLARRLVIGLITSLLVFVPTTILSVLFRRVRPRFPHVDTTKTSSNADLPTAHSGSSFVDMTMSQSFARSTALEVRALMTNETVVAVTHGH